MSTEANVVDQGDEGVVQGSEGIYSYADEVLAAQGLQAEEPDVVEDDQEADGDGESSGDAKSVTGETDTVEKETAEETQEPEDVKEGEGNEPANESIPEKPPKGYVRYEAVTAERNHRRSVEGERDALRSELKKMEQDYEELRRTSQVAMQIGFRKRTPAELRDLAVEDPDAIPAYLEQERQYEQALQALEATKTGYSEEEARNVARYTFDSISAEYPGIYTQGSEANKAFYEAADRAQVPDSVFALLDPAAGIITPGSDKPVPLGDNALALIKLIHDAGREPEKGPDRAAIEKEVRAAVTKELLAKFKPTSPDSSSLADLNSVDRTGPGVPEPTEAQKSRFSEDQWDKYTAGKDWRK